MNRRKCLWVVAFSVFCLALCHTPVFAQGSTASLSGRVVDPNGLIIVGALVQATNVDTGVAYSTVTNQAGLYSLPTIPPGNYRIVVESAGFERAIQSGVSLHVADSLSINFTLQVGSISDSVEVTEQVPLVNTTTSSLGGLVNDRQMADLPLNGRNVDSLMLLQPGVALSITYATPYALGLTGNLFSSNGAPIQSNFYSLDGASMVNAAGVNSSSFLGTTLGVDGVKEFKMVSSAYDATYGQTMGSQMIMLSKSGTNQFHGSAFEYLRNAALDARNFFDTPAASGKTMAGEQRRLPPFQRNQFGGSLGGPIMKEKLFFHLAYEGLRQNVSRTSSSIVPPAVCHNLIPQGSNFGFPDDATASNCAQGLTSATVVPGIIKPLLDLLPTPNSAGGYYIVSPFNKGVEDYGQARLDYNASSKDSFFGRYTIDWTRINNQPQYMNLYEVVGYNHNQYVTVGETHVFSPSFLNTVRISHSRTNMNEINDYKTDLTQPQYQMVPGRPMGLITVGGAYATAWGSGVGYPMRMIQGLSSISDDLFYTKGRHSLKFGTLINRADFSEFYSQFTLGLVTFADLATFMRGNPGVAIADLGNTRRDYRWYTLGFYAQDDFRVTPRFTLNFGLRYEFMSTPNEINGFQARFLHFADPTQTYSMGPPLQNPGYLPFSPRIGFAWDIFGNGKTALRGGTGIYYDVGAINGALIMTMVSQPPISYYATSVNTGQNILKLPLDFSPAYGLVPPINVQSADYYARLPRSYQFNLTFEQQFPLGVGLAVSYLGNQGRRLWQFNEANAYFPSRTVNGVMEWDPYTCNGVLSPIPCTGGAVQAANPNYRRPNPNYGMAILDSTKGYSYYNGLQAVATKRMATGLDFQTSFTWSHLIDTGSGQIFNAEGCGANSLPVNPYDQGMDRGSACADKTYTFRISLLYRLPEFRSNKFVSKLSGGWWFGNIFNAQSGFPFTANLSNVDRSSASVFSSNNPGIDRANLGTTARTVTLPVAGGTYTYNFVPYNKDSVITGDPNHWFNPLMFQLGAVGQVGNAGRSLLRGPGQATWDVSLNKDTKVKYLGEEGALQFRAEFFNILNRANFSMPNPTVFTGTKTDYAGTTEAPAGASVSNPLGMAGKISSTSTTSRQIQFALKVMF